MPPDAEIFFVERNVEYLGINWNFIFQHADLGIFYRGILIEKKSGEDQKNKKAAKRRAGKIIFFLDIFQEIQIVFPFQLPGASPVPTIFSVTVQLLQTGKENLVFFQSRKLMD